MRAPAAPSLAEVHFHTRRSIELSSPWIAHVYPGALLDVLVLCFVSAPRTSWLVEADLLLGRDAPPEADGWFSLVGVFPSGSQEAPAMRRILPVLGRPLVRLSLPWRASEVGGQVRFALSFRPPEGTPPGRPIVVERAYLEAWS